MRDLVCFGAGLGCGDRVGGADVGLRHVRCA